MLNLFKKQESADEDLFIRFTTVTADLGFNTSKFIFDGERYRDLPSIISTYKKPTGDDGLSSPVGSIWDWLKVEIDSTAISDKWKNQAIAVGFAAYSFNQTYDPEPYGNKYKDDRHAIILLSAIAADAIENGTAREIKENHYEVKVFLSTFLPLREFKDKAKREHFINKFAQGRHKVTFLNTVPTHAEKTVEIIFLDHIELNPEGLGNHVRLKYNMDGTETGNEYVDDIHIIADLGGGTLDEAYMKGSYCDPDRSEGVDIGVNELLKRIKKRIETSEEFRGFKFKNLSEVNDMILRGIGIEKREETVEAEERYTFRNKPSVLKRGTEMLKSKMKRKDEKSTGKFYIEWFGQPYDVTNIVEEELKDFCQFRLYTHIKDRLINSPEVKAYFLVGGTSVLVRDYIEEINEQQERPLPIYFVDPHTAYWGLCESGDILGVSYRAENDLLLPEEME